MLHKGIISTVDPDGRYATVADHDKNIVTPRLAVPYYLRGFLTAGTPVIYAAFNDNTGIIIHRQDGEGGIA